MVSDVTSGFSFTPPQKYNRGNYRHPRSQWQRGQRHELFERAIPSPKGPTDCVLDLKTEKEAKEQQKGCRAFKNYWHLCS
jgi:hypothetical protein